MALAGSALARPTCQIVPPVVPGYRPYCPYTIAPDANGDWKAPDLGRARALIRESGTRGESVVVWSWNYFHAESEYFVSLLRQLGYRARLHYISDAGDLLRRAGQGDECPGRVHRLVRRPARRRLARPARVLGHGERFRGILRYTLAASIDRELTNEALFVPLFTPTSSGCAELLRPAGGDSAARLLPVSCRDLASL